jgi:protein-L-isoaspartate O-methyltransferase
MTASRAFLLAALCLLSRSSRVEAADKDHGLFIYYKDDLALVVKTQEQKFPRFDKLHALLDIKPGMIILDIGSGTGQQAYRLAERLRGTGRVYATDIEPRLVGYMTEQAKKRGLKNLEPVLVKADGVDEFYSKHAYDLIVVYDVFAFIHKPSDYFRRLKASLSPGGRVAVVFEPGVAYDFAREDFADWNGFLAELEREPATTLFGRVLAPRVKAALSEIAADDEPARTRAVLLQLNLLLIKTFFQGFTNGLEFKPYVAFTPEEKPFALWLLHRLQLAGVSDGRNRLELLGIEGRDLDMLNKLLIIQRFRKYFKRDGPFPYDSRSMESRWYLDHDNVRVAFEAAGYGTGVKYDFVPFQRVWVFPKENSGTPAPSAPLGEHPPDDD